MEGKRKRNDKDREKEGKKEGERGWGKRKGSLEIVYEHFRYALLQCISKIGHLP